MMGYKRKQVDLKKKIGLFKEKKYSWVFFFGKKDNLKRKEINFIFNYQVYVCINNLVLY